MLDHASQVRAIVTRYRHHLARYQALQQVPGSTWSDQDVARAVRPYRDDATAALHRAGLDADQVAELLAEPSRQPAPARMLGEHMNRLIRGG